tara:strand:+ start:474 stop:686 length:213 start_codon:yes stop_codon:yes gene_type:complete
MEYTGIGDKHPSQIIKMVEDDETLQILTCNKFVGWRDNPDAIKHFVLPDGAGPIDSKKAEKIVQEWSKNW